MRAYRATWHGNWVSPTLASTDELTKEDFNRLIPRRFDSRIDFMFEILKSFSIETAARRNNSFDFFVEPV